MLSSASVHYVLEDCIKKSLIEIPAVRYTHTNSMENAPELRSLGFPSALLCFPLRSSFAQVDLTPMSHLDTTHPVTPPCLTMLHVKASSTSPAFHQWQLMEVFVTVSSSGLHYTPQYFSLLLAKAHSFCFAASLCSGFAIFLCAFSESQLWKKRWYCFRCSLQPASSMTLKRKSP